MVEHKAKRSERIEKACGKEMRDVGCSWVQMFLNESDERK
jgi:hypothetical protein